MIQMLMGCETTTSHAAETKELDGVASDDDELSVEGQTALVLGAAADTKELDDVDSPMHAVNVVNEMHDMDLETRLVLGLLGDSGTQSETLLQAEPITYKYITPARAPK